MLGPARRERYVGEWLPEPLPDPAVDVEGDRITHIWAIRDPDKLRPWTAG